MELGKLRLPSFGLIFVIFFCTHVFYRDLYTKISIIIQHCVQPLALNRYVLVKLGSRALLLILQQRTKNKNINSLKSTMYICYIHLYKHCLVLFCYGIIIIITCSDQTRVQLRRHVYAENLNMDK